MPEFVVGRLDVEAQGYAGATPYVRIGDWGALAAAIFQTSTFQQEAPGVNKGFDYSFGHMGGCIDNYSHFFYWAPPNRHDLWRNGEEVWHDGEFFGELMVEECKRFKMK